jgi:hypothetical protein
MLGGILSTHLFDVGLWAAIETHMSLFAVVLTAVAIAVLVGKELWELTGRRDMAWKPARPLFYVVVVWLIFTIGVFNTDEFIYFQF